MASILHSVFFCNGTCANVHLRNGSNAYQVTNDNFEYSYFHFIGELVDAINISVASFIATASLPENLEVFFKSSLDGNLQNSVFF